MKTCSKCNVDKEETEFYNRPSNRTGLDYHCIPCRKEYIKFRYFATRDVRLEYAKKYQKNKSGEKAIYDRIYREKNKEKIKSAKRKYKQDNKEKRRSIDYSYVVSRRARKINAVPAWADLNKIKEIYERREYISFITGVKHHVDHIVPLNGIRVCGLHVEWNLQIIPAEENLAKSNSYTI